MCGIIGQFCFGHHPDKGFNHPDKELITRMSSILAHRGPDANGTYFDNIVGLAHRRLSIIDLSKEANQPMFNENRNLVIVYNGEIYNYLHLKEILIKCGHEFRSNSDTEVILHAYEEWGVNCLTHFNGMWAFALWDNKKEILFCARDRFGIKPFYYTFDKKSLIFASEIKALLVNPKIGTTPNNSAVNLFLSSGILDYSNKTMFNGIYQILPAHAFVINNNNIKHFKYCYLDINSDTTSIISDDNVAHNTLHLLKKSIHNHLISDVPVGTCLSGGIDSSAIVRIINEKREMQNTFSACFTDERFDESKYIKAVIKDTSIEPFFIEPDPNELLKNIEHLIYSQDEPFGSLSIYAQYCVMQLAHGKCKVLLDGQGADELLAGYLAYQYNYIKELIKRKEFIIVLGELYGTLVDHYAFYYYALQQLLTRNNRKQLLTHYIKTDRYGDTFDKLLWNELFINNLPALLHYEDRNSMAFSIEARVPYLDVEFVNYIASLPYDQKIRVGQTKFALRNAIKGIIPEEIRTRTDKMGFVTPEESWMKYELKDYIMNILYSTSFKNRPYWNSERVLQDYQNFIDGKSIYSPELWRIICVELWLRMFFDQRKSLFELLGNSR